MLWRIQATSIRLICKIWQRTDRAQPLLQRTLRPSWFSEAEFETDVLTSRAVSLKDVCSHDPDAGIELIQSVQACIESRSSILKSIGLQSLALLCGDDAIDFYTAWKVISKFVSPLPENVSVCRSLCMFLKHGAADAAANPEDAKMILNMLWEFSLFGKDASSFSGVRAAAVESLCAYEVELLNETMLDEDKHVDILLRGSGTEAKLQCEKLVFKFLEYEHTNRQRAVTEKTNATKLEKLLDSIPRSFSKSDCPGFLLFFRNATKGNLTGKKSALKAEEAASKRVFLEVVKSLNVFGDLILALLSLVSWSCFMPQWLKHGHDNTELACQKIAKVCMDASDDAIPRISENSTLALAALSKLCPQPSSTSSSLMKHFKTKISLVEHQSAIWSAAIALGVLTTSMHPTDWDAKAQAVRLLIKAASDHNSGFVVGSAAVGLGFACQSLLSSEFSSINSSKDMEILSEILLCVLKQLSHRCPESSSAILELGQDSLLATESITGNDNDRIFKEDNFWASVGLVFALGRLATALGRSGQSDLVKRIGEAVFSWIPDSVGDAEAMSLATGSSLVLPELLQELDRLEALDSGEIDRLLNRLHDLIRKIIDLPESRRNSKPWLVHVFKAGCVGYGGVVAKVLQSGAHPLGIETVTDLLETLCRGYTEIETPQYCLGAMLGLVNALGAGLTSESDLGAIGSGSSLQIQIGDKVTTPLMISSANEESIRTMVQHIVRISHSSDDQRVRDYAKWCLGLMHSTWLRIDQARSSAKDGEDSARTTVRWSYQPVSLSSLAKNNTVRLLCEFLSGVGLTKISVPCSEIITVMRCLEQAPRLPMLDWLGLIRRMMQHPEWFTEQLSGFDHGEVRKQCFILSIRQADRVPPLASVLDEFCEASKLVRVEPKLQLVVLGNLGVLRKVFSQARMEKVLVDVIQVLRQIQSSGDQDHARDCRIEIWRGLAKFWDQTDTKDLLEQIEGCIRELSYISPGRFSTRSSAEAIEQDRVEWSTAVDCLKHARTSWLSDVIKVSQGDYFEKFAFVRCRLAAMKVLPISSLKPIRSQLINQRLTGQWILLTECAIALKTSEFEEKMDWLLDTIDAAYLSKFPSTAISFLGLLASCWSPDSYLFPLDQPAVVRQLHRSLRSLCLHKKWNQSARGGLATKVFAVLERVAEPELASFEETEDELRELSRVLQRVAMSMKEYASHQMLLKLAELSQWE